jgi:thiamine-phosphate pyrophosphorylase
MSALPRFYQIVDDAAWLPRLLPVGVKLVQLRVKDKTELELRAQIIAARDVCASHGAILVINDYWQLAIELGCSYVHLGQEDLDTADVAAIRRAGMQLGISTHDEAELERALALQPDYVALGPVYPTILKQMPWAPQGLERVAQWKARVGNIPLVGIGGLSVERAPGVLAAGADCVAVVTDVLLNANPEARTREWLDATKT